MRETIDRHEKTFENQKKTENENRQKRKGKHCGNVETQIGHRKKENM